MKLDQYNAYCRLLQHAHHSVQWGDAHVWKVATKVFAIGRWTDDKRLHVSFKVSPASFEILKEQPGLRPAPYLASRGMSWIQRTDGGAMNDKALKQYLAESHRLASLNLTKAVQRELGLNQP